MRSHLGKSNKAAQFGSGILAINGVEITMEDGAVIRNNTNRNYELGGGILLGNGSIFTMNGGEISGNTANGGGGVAIIGSTMVMNGGTISNNSTYKIIRTRQLWCRGLCCRLCQCKWRRYIV